MIINIIHEVELTDGEYYPIRFSTECERSDAGHIEIISRTMWNERFYDLAQNALIRRFAESKEMKALVNEYIDKNKLNDF